MFDPRAIKAVVKWIYAGLPRTEGGPPMPTPEQVAAAMERLTRFYVIGKLEQVEVHGIPMGLGDSSVIVLQALSLAQAELTKANEAIRAACDPVSRGIRQRREWFDLPAVKRALKEVE